MREEITIHRMRSFSDDFEEDQSIRFQRVVHVNNLAWLDKQIEKVQEDLDRLEEQRRLEVRAMDNWEKKYGSVE